METGSDSLKIALISEVFSTEEALVSCLLETHKQGADLAVLPELPLNEWSPATRQARAEDAESPGGWRETVQRNAARRVGIAVLGGVIRVMHDGHRINLAVLIDAHGDIAGTSEKHVLPDEEGFRECDHYEPADNPPRIIECMGTKIGVQICSDANRPTAAQLLAAQGVQVILAPRATSPSSWNRWRLAYRAMALTASAWVVSVGRPRSEFGVEMGGPSLVVDPMGEVVLETMERISTVEIDRHAVTDARQSYPGYLAWPAKAYVTGWQEILNRQQDDD